MKKLIALFLFAVLQLFFIGCSGAGITAETLSTFSGVTVTPEQSAYPEADAVILASVDSVVVTVVGDALLTNQYKYRSTKLFRNLEENATEQVFISESQRLVSIMASVKNPDGREIALKDEDFFTITGQGGDGILYSEGKNIRFTYPMLTKGSIVSYYYVVQETRPFVNGAWLIQDQLPVLRNRYSLTLPRVLVEPRESGGAGWDYNYKNYNCTLSAMMVDNHEDYNKIRTGYDRIITFIWEEKNIEPVEQEPKMPPALDVMAYVRFAPSDWRTWNDVAHWYFTKFFSPQVATAGPSAELSLGITKDLTSETDKISALYKYVQNIRYVAIALGDGGYRPHLTKQTIANQYGDCKDKSLLLIELLRSAGIKADPVLVLTRSHGRTDPEFPNWSFNHMVVRATDANNKVYWLDGTAKFGSIRDIPDQIEGIYGLVIDDSGNGKMQIIPQSGPDENTTDISVKIKFTSPETQPTADVEIVFRGEENVDFRYRFEDISEKEAKDFCKGILYSFTNPEILSYSISDIDSGNAYRLRFTFTAENILQRQGDLYFLNASPVRVGGDLYSFTKDERVNHILFSYPSTENLTTTIVMPEGFELRTKPDNLDYASGYFSYLKVFSEPKNGEMKFNEKFILKRRVIPVEDYKGIPKIARNIKSKSSEKIVLVKAGKK